MAKRKGELFPSADKIQRKVEARARDRADKYERKFRAGFRDKWSIWYPLMRWKLLSNWTELAALDPYERSATVGTMISNMSKAYRSWRKEAELKVAEEEKAVVAGAIGEATVATITEYVTA